MVTKHFKWLLKAPSPLYIRLGDTSGKANVVCGDKLAYNNNNAKKGWIVNMLFYECAPLKSILFVTFMMKSVTMTINLCQYKVVWLLCLPIVGRKLWIGLLLSLTPLYTRRPPPAFWSFLYWITSSMGM